MVYGDLNVFTQELFKYASKKDFLTFLGVGGGVKSKLEKIYDRSQSCIISYKCLNWSVLRKSSN